MVPVSYDSVYGKLIPYQTPEIHSIVDKCVTITSDIVEGATVGTQIKYVPEWIHMS